MTQNQPQKKTAPDTVVFTNKAQCQDCYRCLRHCPVKAIRMHDGQAQVVDELCIQCGTCIRECPQHAKTYREDITTVQALLNGKTPVAASIAPSFAAAFPDWQQGRLPSALRQLGFHYVGETAIGAFHVARETAHYIQQHPDSHHICSACPAVVNLIERHHPELIDTLVPVVSPMIAHARHIRRRFDHPVKVVFIGPCIAKKGEADRAPDDLDAVISFAELRQLLQRHHIDLGQCEESAFDESPDGDARLFPLEGGTLRTAALTTDILADAVIPVSGIENIEAALASLPQATRPLIIEPLFCSGGCINGPVLDTETTILTARQQILTYNRRSTTDHPHTTNNAANNPNAAANLNTAAPSLHTAFTPKAPPSPDFTEDQIRTVLLEIGKATPQDELNCGACGYASCRDKARAVLRGLAEPQMCIPYMRRLAEKRSDRVIETSPNGIVMLDADLKLIGMNSAFKRMFMCSEAVIGKPISYLMDPHDFEKLANGEKELIEASVVHRKYNLVCHQILYELKQERQYIGIFVNITQSQSDRDKLRHLRAETMLKAQELLKHQFSMAQKMVQFLGQSTADGEDLLQTLMVLAEDESNRTPSKELTPWDTPTLK